MGERGDILLRSLLDTHQGRLLLHLLVHRHQRVGLQELQSFAMRAQDSVECRNPAMEVAERDLAVADCHLLEFRLAGCCFEHWGHLVSAGRSLDCHFVGYFEDYFEDYSEDYLDRCRVADRSVDCRWRFEGYLDRLECCQTVDRSLERRSAHWHFGDY